MSKDFILTTDELFGSYCYIEQKRYGVPNEKFLYKIIGKFTSNAWSNVPVDANDKEPHIFNHSEEVVNVVCCGVCEDKIERYKLSDVEIISNKDQQLADLEAKLAESEKDKQFYFFENGEKGLKIRELKQQVNDWKQRFESSEERNKQMTDNGVKALELKNEKIKELKQQLAEKDKDIKYFKESYYMIQDEKDHYAGQCLNLQDRIEELEKIINESFHNQDKISFAIEQLTLFKNSIVNKMNNPYSVNIKHILSDFDNQIKELTHQQEDK